MSTARRGIKGCYCARCGHDRRCESRCMWKQGSAAALGWRRWLIAHVRTRSAPGKVPVKAAAVLVNGMDSEWRGEIAMQMCPGASVDKGLRRAVTLFWRASSEGSGFPSAPDTSTSSTDHDCRLHLD